MDMKILSIFVSLIGFFLVFSGFSLYRQYSVPDLENENSLASQERYFVYSASSFYKTTIQTNNYGICTDDGFPTNLELTDYVSKQLGVEKSTVVILSICELSKNDYAMFWRDTPYSTIK